MNMRLEDQLGEIVATHDLEGWLRVPAMVVALYKQAAPAACRLAAWADAAAGPLDRLWWHGDTATAWAEVADFEKRADWEALPDIPGVPGVALFIEPIGPPPVAGWVLVKAADGYLAPIARPHEAAQSLIGGPNGLTSAIVSGLLGGGLGYGAGWIADQFLPEEHVNKGRLPLTLGLGGAAMGVVPGLWQWTAERRAKGLGAFPGMEGTGKPVPTGQPGDPWPHEPLPPHMPGINDPPFVGPPAPRLARSTAVPTGPGEPGPSGSVLDADGTKLNKVGSIHPWMRKAAQDFASTGAMFAPSIPVADFGHAVWSDVRGGPGAFGASTPSWGGGTPPYAAAAVTGLLAGTAQAARSPVVSPWQVGTAAAMGAGKGWLAGMAAGKVLGLLAGLKPEAQQKLQDVGLWGGMITGVANSLYR